MNLTVIEFTKTLMIHYIAVQLARQNILIDEVNREEGLYFAII